MDKRFAKSLLELTAKTYDEIAQSFSDTRSWRQKEIESLIISNIAPDGKILDIGCGNGRFFEFFKKIGATYTGIDNSKKLVQIARRQYPGERFEVADATDLPFPAEIFDAVAAIAALHHIPSKELRVRFFYEARRVLKAGGIFIATAWDLRPSHMIKAGEWKRLRYFAKEQIAIAAGLSKLDFGDFYIPWQNKHQRYVHALTVGELKGLAQAVGFMVLEAGVLKFQASKEQSLYIVCRKMQ